MGMVVMDWWVDLMILEVFSNLHDSMILCFLLAGVTSVWVHATR